MKLRYSKSFKKSYDKQSGKLKESIIRVIKEVKNAKSLNDITDCKRVVNTENIYRIRIGDFRIFFFYNTTIQDDDVFFIALVPRGEAYDKKTMQNIKKFDNH